MSERKSLTDHLRYALNHLYEPDRLRRSPLMRLLLGPEEREMPMVLSRTLTEAIESLRTDDCALSDPGMERTYELLYYRYVQCARQKDLARQLAVSVRQVRREQSRALEVLAEHLRHRFDLSLEQMAGPSETGQASEEESDVTDILSEELKWLRQEAGETANLRAELESVFHLLQLLLEENSIRLDIEIGPSYSDLALAMPSIVLRQALLSLLTWLIKGIDPDHLSVQITEEDWHAELGIQTRNNVQRRPTAVDMNADALHDAERLFNLYGGTMATEERHNGLLVTVRLPLQGVVPVLVVDDNKDTLQLMERYVAGTRYRIILNHDPKQTLLLVDEERPALVVLDIMMTSIDGWNLLRQIRDRLPSADCPIIVCTVLAQESVATSLGANEFLRKPVSRQTFLQALDRQCATLGRSPAPEP